MAFSIARAKELRALGVSYNRIARDVGASVQQVRYALDEAHRIRRLDRARAIRAGTYVPTGAAPFGNPRAPALRTYSVIVRVPPAPGTRTKQEWRLAVTATGWRDARRQLREYLGLVGRRGVSFHRAETGQEFL